MKARGRGTYNSACDVCARKKIKCDGIKPVCQPCQSQGRQEECKWTKKSTRKPRTEDKQIENLHKRADLRNYIQHLESLLDKHVPQHHSNFRASRPADYDELLGQPEDTLDHDSNNHCSPDENDSNESGPLMAMSMPPSSLQIEPFGTRFTEDPDKTYVLFVDGVHPSHRNPNFEWSRYLPSNIPSDRPLDRRSHDRALDLLFKFTTSWCLRIVPTLFLRDMYRALSVPRSQTPPKTPHYSPMLHNALVALALALLDDPKLTDLKARWKFAETAKGLMEEECRRPNLSVVHALSILSTFHNSQGDQTLGYMYFGMSAHMSQTLGLSMDCSEWVKLGVMDEAERLDRHWSSWTNFTQDVCWSFYVGRNFCVAPPDVDIPSMSYIHPEFDQKPWVYPPADIPQQHNNLSKTFVVTCRLLIISRRIMDVINGVNKARSRPVLDSLIAEIDNRLNKWKSSLSAELEVTPMSATPHKLMLHLAYWWLFILLHRPFFYHKSRPILSTDREINHVELCRGAAERIMDLLSTWRSLYTLRYCPVTLIQTVFSTGTVYFLVALQASSGNHIAEKEFRYSWDQATLARQYLSEIGTSWKCATSTSDILISLMEKHVRPLLDRKTKTIQAATVDHSDVGDGEEENGASSSSKSSSIMHNSSSIIRMGLYQVAQPYATGQSSLSALPHHTLTAPASSTGISPSLAQRLNPSTINISSTYDTSSTHVGPSVPIAIPSQSPSSLSAPWGPQPNLGSSSRFPDNVSFVNDGFLQPFSNINRNDDPFSSNDNDSTDSGGQHSLLAQNPQFISWSSQDQYAGGYLSMLGGQTFWEAPVIGPFEEDAHNYYFTNLPQALSGLGLHNREPPSSHRQWFPSSSHGDNNGMDVDNML